MTLFIMDLTTRERNIMQELFFVGLRSKFSFGEEVPSDFQRFKKKFEKALKKSKDENLSNTQLRFALNYLRDIQKEYEDDGPLDKDKKLKMVEAMFPGGPE